MKTTCSVLGPIPDTSSQKGKTKSKRKYTPGPLNESLLGALRSLLDGTWGVLKDSLGVLARRCRLALLDASRRRQTRANQSGWATTVRLSLQALPGP